MKSRRSMLVLGAGLLLLMAACSSSDSDEGADAQAEQSEAALAVESEAEAPPPTLVPSDDAATTGDDTPLAAGNIVLADGTFELPAANSFGDAGFHFAFHTTATLPADLGSTAGSQLVVMLLDASRPEVACGSNHPLSGCTTIDWSDFEGRPGVPPGGVFDNRLTLETTAGKQDFFLTENSGLATVQDAYSPG